MGKILSEKERKLQRKLIPLNIFVCILSLVAAASLMFGQIFSIDFGKILRSDATYTLVDNAINGTVEEDTSEAEGGNQVDFKPIIAMIVSNVLGSAEGSINISAYSASKVAFASGDDKAEKVMDELFFGDGALVTKLINSIVDNVAGLFKTDSGKQLIEELVVSTITTSLISNLTPTDEAKVNENKTELTDTFKKIGDAADREAAAAAADDFIDKLDDVLESFDKEKDGETFKDYIMGMYDDTAAETDGNPDKFSAEALISVAVSKNLDLSTFDLGGLFGEGGEEPEGSKVKRTVEDEIGGNEAGNGEEEGGNENPGVTDPDPDNPGPIDPDDPDNPDPVDPDNPDPDDPNDPDPDDPDNPGPVIPDEPGPDTPDPEPNPGEDDKVICTTYEELLAQMGLGDEQMDDLKEKLGTSLQSLVKGFTEPIADYFAFYGYIFYGMLVFIVPWLILFLFSFFHMFAKNKRFMMWYVKLYSWIPGAISLVFILAPKLVDKIPVEESMLDTLKALLEGISSQMWISGICYIVLWLVSIFWAFPIKHKIRKERKLAKLYNSTFGGHSGGGSPNGGYNAGNGGNNYQSPYEDNRYNSSPYGQPAYGGSTYNAPYDDAYDHGGFNAPYTGSYYGYDEDDF